MHSETLTSSLNRNVPSVDVSHIKNMLISAGLIDGNYNMNIYSWAYNANGQYSYIVYN